MLTKPISECDESDLRALVAESEMTINRFKSALSTYSMAVRLRQRALSELRTRFAFDAVTGRRVSRRGQLL